MKSLTELADAADPAIGLIREWVTAAPAVCELLPPSADREATPLGVQVTRRSVLGALAYDMGGLLAS
jgi:hypothetical protein